MNGPSYVGRLAPSPTGLLHLGHARTFWIAHQRARRERGRLLLRCDDLDGSRCRPDFVAAAEEDLRWLGLDWDGPPILQSGRLELYRAAFEALKAAGRLYPCWCTRREIEAAAAAPHEADGEEEPIYPGTCRPGAAGSSPASRSQPPCWRFLVPDGEKIAFEDGRLGGRTAVAGRDFGDFIVWRKDGQPSYQLACAVDDTDPGLAITEVVRGADLVRSTFRQILVARALGRTLPAYFHCALLRDDAGRRLAKRHDSLSLRALRAQGADPKDIVRRLAEADSEASSARLGVQPPGQAR